MLPTNLADHISERDDEVTGTGDHLDILVTQPSNELQFAEPSLFEKNQDCPDYQWKVQDGNSGAGQEWYGGLTVQHEPHEQLACGWWHGGQLGEHDIVQHIYR